jgi:hypothetical protein
LKCFLEFKTPPKTRKWQPPSATNLPSGEAVINPKVISAIANTLLGQGFRQHGDWLHGRCIHPERHTNGDRNPSFGFNTRGGYAYCYRCGTMLAKEVCQTLNIDPYHYGGLVERPEPPRMRPVNKANLGCVPDDVQPENKPPKTAYKLPSWLQQHMDWAGATGNQTPMIFHQAAGLWLLSTAIGRRLYGEAPWGVKLYPNLYLMLVAGTTFYRKSTAYKLAEQVARDAIPHMLMPTPGSPERFQEALAGQDCRPTSTS